MAMNWWDANTPQLPQADPGGFNRYGGDFTPIAGGQPALPGQPGGYAMPDLPGMPGYSGAPVYTTQTQAPGQPQGGGDPQAQYMAAVNALGLSPQQVRGNQQQIADYLNKQSGTNDWSASTSAGDWISYQGKGFDTVPAGDASLQWLRDPGTQEPGYRADGGGGGGFNAGMAGGIDPYQAPTFTAPSGLTMENDPGFKARMAMGQEAIEGSAAARGGILSGGTLKALAQYGQDYGSNEYGNVFNRALTTAGYNAGMGQQGYQNRYGQYQDWQNWAQRNKDRGQRAGESAYRPPPA